MAPGHCQATWGAAMNEPTPEQRATFMWMFLGMAKDYGYTRALLLADIAKCWDAAKPTSELPPKRTGPRQGTGDL